MFAFFQLLINKFTAVLTWIGNLFKAVFVALWDIMKDAVCWILESLMGIAVNLVNSFDVSGIQSNLAAFGSLPGNVMEVVSALGLGTAFTIIASAIGVRFVLQLIPMVRLGS